MSCAYEKYIEMGGVSGTLSRARAGELLRLHRQQHPPGSRCPASIAPADPEIEHFQDRLAFHESARAAEENTRFRQALDVHELEHRQFAASAEGAALSRRNGAPRR